MMLLQAETVAIFFLFIITKLSFTHPCSSTSVNISFSDEPSLYFTETPTDIVFLNTKTTRIKCKADGRPKPTISWIYANGGAVGNISGIRHIISDGTLEFPAFLAKDFNVEAHNARYKCVAKNDVGTLHSSAFSVKAGMLLLFYEN